MSASPVSIHPYFKAHPGKLDAVKGLLPTFVEKTASEAKVLHYEFTINGDEIFCRETYEDAEGTLAHPLLNQSVRAWESPKSQLPSRFVPQLRQAHSAMGALFF